MKAMAAKFDARALKLGLALGLGLTAAGAALSPAHAFSVDVDEIIYEAAGGVNPANLSGSVNMALIGTTLRVTLTNTSTATSSQPSTILLTGLGFNLPTGTGVACATTEPAMNSDGCTVKMNHLTDTSTAAQNNGTPLPTFDSAAINFTEPSDGSVSNEWGWETIPLEGPFQPSPGGLVTEGSVNVVVAALQAATDQKFASGSTDDPTVLDGPEMGLLSASMADSAAGGLNAIKSSVVIDIALSGTIPSPGDLDTFINSNQVVLAFGSPNSSFDLSPEGPAPVAEPASLGLLAVGLLGTAAVRRRRSNQAA
jgi:hypothetical protein